MSIDVLTLEPDIVKTQQIQISHGGATIRYLVCYRKWARKNGGYGILILELDLLILLRGNDISFYHIFIIFLMKQFETNKFLILNCI